MRNSYITALTLIICFVAIMVTNVSAYVHDSNYPFIIITKDSVTQAPQFTDEEFYSLSTSVIFKVNRTEVSSDDAFFSLYNDTICAIINKKHLQLRKIYIRGAASPEGPYLNNKRLGRGRSQFLLNALQKSLCNQYVKVDTEVNSVTEDYGYLCVLMRKANDPDYAFVKAIYDECGADEICCKQRLMKARGGKLWQRLLKQYFPQLRSARLVLWFSEPDEEHAPLTLPEPVSIVPKSTYVPTDAAITNQVVLPEPEPTLEPLPRRHLIAVRTNLVHDLFYMPQFGWAFSPNVQLEYYPLKGHYTYNIGMTWGTKRKWNSQEFFQVRDFQLELRRYFRGGGRFLGSYLGAYVNGGVYGIGLSPTKGWQGEGGGAGVTFGYTTKLNRRGNLRLELMAAAGFYMTLFDPYVWGNPVTNTINGYYYYQYYGSAKKFKKRNHRFVWTGPTNVGIQLTYDIIYRKRQSAK